jgi:hypothetical protein
MLRYIYKLFEFIIPLFIIVLLLFNVASENHEFQPTSMYYNQEFESAFKDKNYFDVVAIGNSKLLSAIDKKTLEENNKHSVVNIGYSSSNISVSKLTLESYLNNCSTNPQLILLEVSWFTFNNKRTHLHGIVGDLFIRDFKLWKNYYHYDSELLLPKIKKSWKTSLKTSLKKIIGIKHSSEQTSYADIFKDPSPHSVDYKFDIKEMEVIFPEHVAGINKSLLKDFYSIISMCRNRNIDLILFTAPEDEKYSKLQKDIQEIKNIFVDVAGTNSNVFYLDYSLGGDLYSKSSEKWLLNSHHINENTLFSKKLLGDIKARTHNNVYKK